MQVNVLDFSPGFGSPVANLVTTDFKLAGVSEREAIFNIGRLLGRRGFIIIYAS